MDMCAGTPYGSGQGRCRADGLGTNTPILGIGGRRVIPAVIPAPRPTTRPAPPAGPALRIGGEAPGPTGRDAARA
ncbi:hypothetical protein GCM10009647_064920 [Streptomyces sanglieri]